MTFTLKERYLTENEAARILWSRPNTIACYRLVDVIRYRLVQLLAWDETRAACCWK